MSDPVTSLKLQLERSLTRRLDPLLKRYIAEHGEAATGGLPLDRARWARILANLLLDHATTTWATFTARRLDLDTTLADIAPAHHQELTREAYHHAGLILDGIDREIAAGRVRSKFSALGLNLKARSTLPNWAVALVGVLDRVTRGTRRRAAAAATMATQATAERARRSVVEVRPDGEAGNQTLWKRWVTKQDERVRPAHAAAHSQMVQVQDPFVVGGERLMHPGDVSMGASLGNVINCRCRAVYYADNGDGTFTELGIETPSVPARRMRRPGAPIGSNRPKVPTSTFTFPTGRTRGQIVLPDGTMANFTVDGGAITLRVNRKPVASAPLYRGTDGTFSIGTVRVDPAQDRAAIEGLLRDSTRATNDILRAQP